jgi:hypothetical protein
MQVASLATRLLSELARSFSLFAWLISHQSAVLFSHNKPATSNQSAVLFSHNKPAPATSQQYFSLGTNQHQPSATKQTNSLLTPIVHI